MPRLCKTTNTACYLLCFKDIIEHLKSMSAVSIELVSWLTGQATQVCHPFTFCNSSMEHFLDAGKHTYSRAITAAD